jgi:comEA protein
MTNWRHTHGVFPLYHGCFVGVLLAAGFSPPNRPPSWFAAKAAELGSPATANGNANSQPQPAKKININSASQAELEQLPGIGPELAKRIIEFRRNNPPFKKIEELMIIKGISRKVFNRIRDRIAVQ